jgi:hypothetical protein
MIRSRGAGQNAAQRQETIVRQSSWRSTESIAPTKAKRASLKTCPERSRRVGWSAAQPLGANQRLAFTTACRRRPVASQQKVESGTVDANSTVLLIKCSTVLPRSGWGLSAWDSLLPIPDYMHPKSSAAAGRESLLNVKQRKWRLRAESSDRSGGRAKKIFKIRGRVRVIPLELTYSPTVSHMVSRYAHSAASGILRMIRTAR